MCSYLILLNTNPFFYFNIYLQFFSRKKIKSACTWFSDCIKLCKNQCALSKETCTSQLKAKSPQKSWMKSKELRVGKDGGRVLLVGLQLPHGSALWKRHTGIAQTLGSAKGALPECWGVGKGLQWLLLLISWVWAQAETEPKAKLPTARLIPKG